MGDSERSFIQDSENAGKKYVFDCLVSTILHNTIV